MCRAEGWGKERHPSFCQESGRGRLSCRTGGGSGTVCCSPRATPFSDKGGGGEKKSIHRPQGPEDIVPSLAEREAFGFGNGARGLKRSAAVNHCRDQRAFAWISSQGGGGRGGRSSTTSSKRKMGLPPKSSLVEGVPLG